MTTRRIDFSDDAAEGYCLCCSEDYRSAATKCESCGANILPRATLESAVAASCARSETSLESAVFTRTSLLSGSVEAERSRAVLEAAGIPCLLVEETGDGEFRVALPAESPSLELENDSPGPTSSSNSFHLYVEDEDIHAAKKALDPKLSESSVLVRTAESDLEASLVAETLERNGIHFSTERFTRQFALQTGDLSEIHFYVLQEQADEASIVLEEMESQRIDDASAQEGTDGDEGDVGDVRDVRDARDEGDGEVIEEPDNAPDSEPEAAVQHGSGQGPAPSPHMAPASQDSAGTIQDFARLNIERRYRLARTFVSLTIAIYLLYGAIFLVSNSLWLGGIAILLAISLTGLMMWSFRQPFLAFAIGMILLLCAVPIGMLLDNNYMLLPGIGSLLTCYYAFRSARAEEDMQRGSPGQSP